MPHYEFDLGQGHRAELVQFDGDRGVLIATRPSPPGSTLAARGAANQAFSFKVRGSARSSDGRFRIEGRFVSLSRDQRDELARTLAAGGEPAEPNVPPNEKP